MASRYAAYDSPSPSSSNPKKPTTIKALLSNSSSSSSTSSRALVKTKPADVAPAKNGQNIGAMVKRLIKPKDGSADRAGLAVPRNVIAEDARKNAAAAAKGSNFSALHRKLFQKSGGGKEGSAPKALTEVKSNTRTLAMVLRSERELLAKNKEYEAEVLELRMALEEKNREAKKLKDLCLKQREEIKALKDAILFPDVMNAQLQVLLEKQGSELKQAKEVIPNLQKQVSSLTGQLFCLAEDLAEVKADKHTGRSCSDVPFSSPRTPIYDGKGVDSSDFSSMQPITSDSLDDMFLKDLNPCLTPCFSKIKSKEYDEMLSDDSFSEDESFGENSQSSSHVYVSSHGEKVYKSSEHYNRSGLSRTPHNTYKSDGMRLNSGKVCTSHSLMAKKKL